MTGRHSAQRTQPGALNPTRSAGCTQLDTLGAILLSLTSKAETTERLELTQTEASDKLRPTLSEAEMGRVENGGGEKVGEKILKKLKN